MNYDELVKCASEYEKDMHERCEYLKIFYRGQAEDWPLESKLKRKLKNSSKLYELEKYSIPNSNTRSAIEQIAYLQHYGSPTRLLDYSRSLDVALFFACRESMDADGVLYMCSYQERWLTNLDVQILCEIANIREKTDCLEFAKKFCLKYPGYGKSIQEIRIEVIARLSHGFMISPSEIEMNEIRETNQRLYRQKGCFYITGNKMEPENARPSTAEKRTVWIIPELNDLPTTVTDPVRSVKKVIIPCDEKKNILRVLEKKGITETYLLPEDNSVKRF